MRTKAKIISAALAASGLACSAPAFAATAGPAPVAVTLTIENSCTFGGTGTLNFGTRTAGNAASNVDAQSTGLSINCTGDSPTATINVSGGNNFTGTQRRLKLGAANTFVPYDLYTDAGRTTKFDPTIFQTLPGGLIAGTRDIVVYGRIPAGTLLINGNGTAFTDTVSVTITY